MAQPTQKFWGGNLGEAKMFDCRRITTFCLGKRLSKHKMTVFSKNLRDPWPLLHHAATAMSHRYAVTNYEATSRVNVVILVYPSIWHGTKTFEVLLCCRYAHKSRFPEPQSWHLCVGCLYVRLLCQQKWLPYLCWILLSVIIVALNISSQNPVKAFMWLRAPKVLAR